MASSGGKRKAEPPPRPPSKRKAEPAPRPPSKRKAESAPRPQREKSTPLEMSTGSAMTAPTASTLKIRQMAWIIGVYGSAILIGILELLSATPDWLPRAIAVVLTCLLALGLTVRSGGHVPVVLLLSGALGLAALLIPSDLLRAGCAVGAAAVAACLGVLATKPATTYLQAIREVLIALSLALAGSMAALGFASNVNQARLSYVVLVVALGGSIALIYRLGAGLHGLGQRGYLMVAGALLLLAIALAYTAALRQWGSIDLNSAVVEAQGFIRRNAFGVPIPVVFFVGVPALAWGAFMRARRRQGWWVSAFGAAATAPMTMVAVDRSIPLLQASVGMSYSILLGLLIGFLLVRVEQFLDTGATSKRSRRAEEHLAHRPEPSRMSPLH
ncbi:MAG: hypothetical protein R2693_12130 [Nocardioidaceae bacterium]